MFAGLYFIHIISLSLWLGALLVMLVLLNSKKVTEQQTLAAIMLGSRVWGILQIAALAVFGSGLGLIIKMGLLGQSKPLWLKLMEEGGGAIALLFVILVTLMARKLRKAVNQAEAERLSRLMRRLSVLSVAFALAIAAVVLIVSMRIA